MRTLDGRGYQVRSRHEVHPPAVIEVDPVTWLFRTFGEKWGMQMGNCQIKGNLLRQRVWLRYGV